jgi:hypothetical protein
LNEKCPDLGQKRVTRIRFPVLIRGPDLITAGVFRIGSLINFGEDVTAKPGRD